MPFKSMAQRRKFYALKNQGKMDQATIDEWESQTPENIPERVEKKAMSYKEKFMKLAYGKAYASDAGAFLNWNEGAGLIPINDQDSQAASAAGLKTLPRDIDGAHCGSCKYFRITDEKKGLGLCQNPDVRQDVTVRMLCDFWEHPGVIMAVETPPEQDMAGAVPPEEEMQGDIPPSEGGIPPEGATPGEVPPPVDGSAPEGAPSPAGGLSPAGSEDMPEEQGGEASLKDELNKQMPDLEEKTKKKKPEEKKNSDKKEKSGENTININVGSEKKASFTDMVMEWI